GQRADCGRDGQGRDRSALAAIAEGPKSRHSRWHSEPRRGKINRWLILPENARDPLSSPELSFRDAAMPETFILIPGRTSRQGCGISEGKFKEEYQEETNVLQVSPQDMERLGLATGDRVRVRSETGQIEVPVTPSRGDELPPGLLFIAYGD